MYWEATPDTFARSDSMPLNTFKRIFQNLQLCDNEQLDKLDVFSKLFPVISKSNRTFLKLSFNRYNKSVMAVANK